MNQTRFLSSLLALTGLVLLLGIAKPIARYFSIQQQSRELARIRLELSQPILIHQALRGLTTATSADPETIEVRLQQLNQGLEMDRHLLDPEFSMALRQASVAAETRLKLVSRLMVYDISLDIFDSSLGDVERTARIEATTNALTQLQSQLVALEATSSTTQSLVDSIRLFLETLNTTPLPDESLLVAELSQLQSLSRAFITTPLTSPEIVGGMTNLNQSIERLRTKELQLLGDLAGDVGNP